MQCVPMELLYSVINPVCCRRSESLWSSPSPQPSVMCRCCVSLCSYCIRVDLHVVNSHASPSMSWSSAFTHEAVELASIQCGVDPVSVPLKIPFQPALTQCEINPVSVQNKIVCSLTGIKCVYNLLRLLDLWSGIIHREWLLWLKNKVISQKAILRLALILLTLV